MDYLIARKKGRMAEFIKLLSGMRIFDCPKDLENAIEYQNSYILEEDEWFVLSDFSVKEYCIDLLKEPFDSTDFVSIRGQSYTNIDYICSYQNGNEYYFQKVYKRRFVEKKRFIELSGEVSIKETGEGIIINNIPDALYIKSEDKLFFKKLQTISVIFKGIESLYREATKTEVEDFLHNNFITLGENYGEEKVGKANRHRIALMQDTLKGLKGKQKKKLFDYTVHYYPDLKYDGRTFMIQNDLDLKKLLYGIEQRYYTTPVTNEKRRANSVLKIE